MTLISPKLSKLSLLLLLVPFFSTPSFAGGDLEAPKLDKKFYLLGLTLTPGGFIAAEGLWRQRNEVSDIGSNFSAIPLGNNPLYYMNETRFTARQSRLSLLIEGAVNPNVLLSGYYEADFLGNGTANSNESNSYDLRQRVIYATLDHKESKTQLLAGQNWSLTTTNFKGITPRNEVLPPTIDAQYVVGYVWKRQAQLRLTQEFGDKLWGAISVENPQATYSVGGASSVGIANSKCSSAQTSNNPNNNIICTGLTSGINDIIVGAIGSGTLPAQTTYSLNRIPDVVAKIAFETKVGEKGAVHVEGFGLYRNLYDRVEYSNGNNVNKNTNVGGGGVGAIVKMGILDLQGNFMKGRGIGTYASGQLPDATIRSDGGLTGIPETVYMLGATLHATPHTDFYVFGGKEKENRRYFMPTSTTYSGYGVPNANNTGCTTEYNSTCNGATRSLSQVTVGLWNKFYQGVYGDLRGGLQYSYTKRDLFDGTDSTGISTGYDANEQMVLASLRYYPFTV